MVSACPFFVESHHYGASTVAAHSTSLLEELGLALFQADGIDEGFALDALQTGFENAPFGAVDHDRHARNLGFGAYEIQKRGHRLLGVEHAFVHVDVDDVCAVAYLLKGHRDRFRVVASGDQLPELGRAGHVGPLADHEEIGLWANDQRLEPAESRIVRVTLGFRARRHVPDGLGDGPDVVRRRAAAATNDVDHPVRGEAAQELGHLLRSLIVAAERVGQTCVGIAMHVAIRDPGKLVQERAHLLSAQRAVDPDCQRPSMLDRDVERLDGLAGQGAAALIYDGDRNHDGKTDALFGKDVVDRTERSLGIECIEDRFDEQEVRATIDQAAHLLRICFARLVERERSEAWIIDVRTEAQGLVERADCAGNEARPVGATGGCLFGKARRGNVEIVHHFLQLVVRLRERVRVERVGFDDVRAGV